MFLHSTVLAESEHCVSACLSGPSPCWKEHNFRGTAFLDQAGRGGAAVVGATTKPDAAEPLGFAAARPTDSWLRRCGPLRRRAKARQRSPRGMRFRAYAQAELALKQHPWGPCTFSVDSLSSSTASLGLTRAVAPVVAAVSASRVLSTRPCRAPVRSLSLSLHCRLLTRPAHMSSAYRSSPHCGHESQPLERMFSKHTVQIFVLQHSMSTMVSTRVTSTQHTRHLERCVKAGVCSTCATGLVGTQSTALCSTSTISLSRTGTGTITSSTYPRTRTVPSPVSRNSSSVHSVPSLVARDSARLPSWITRLRTVSFSFDTSEECSVVCSRPHRSESAGWKTRSCDASIATDPSPPKPIQHPSKNRRPMIRSVGVTARVLAVSRSPSPSLVPL
mmetsp:Transcript_28170/g.74367  ORF Transcript_28170/g.74367 Transcript_28170/m.74367 type:complete len:389 (+) Transcript_28170:201-1367(+)